MDGKSCVNPRTSVCAEGYMLSFAESELVIQ